MRKISLWLFAILFLTFNFQLSTFNCASAAEKGLLFSDDFSRDGGDWEALNGSWELDNGEYKGTGDGMAVAGDENWSDYVYETRIKTEEAGEASWNVGMLTFRVADPDNWYFVLLHTNKNMELGKRFNGQHTPGLANIPGSGDPKQWNTIRIEVKKANIKIFVNGKKKLDFTDPEPIENGSIGFWENGASTCRYDDVKVWEYGKAPELTAVASCQLPVVSEIKKEEKPKAEAVKPKAEAAGELGEVFRDDFSKGAKNWDVLGGEWEVKDGKYFGAELDGGNAITYAASAADIEAGAFEVKVTVTERAFAEQWAFFGIIIGTDASNFWLLGFTEGPAQEHYVDFLESLEGTWQAQSEAATKLKAKNEKDMYFKWEYNKEYKFRLEMGADGITGKIVDLKKDSVLAQRTWVFGEMTAVRMGKPGLISRGMKGYYKDAVVLGKGVKKI